MTNAYAIAWLGELGGVQYIQIASESPDCIERHGVYPFQVLILSAQGKTFADASRACKEMLAQRVPSWLRFMRNPSHLQQLSKSAAVIKASGRLLKTR